MGRYERENTQPVISGLKDGAAPDPETVVAQVGPDGRITLGRLNLDPPTPEPEIESEPRPDDGATAPSV